jgi:RNA polymerase sigma factor (sigma-70 family)
MSFFSTIFSQTSKTQTDSDLLNLYLQTGNIQHLGRLYDRYIALVYGVCLRYLKNEEDSKDLVMQIFEKLTTKLRTNPEQPVSNPILNFQAWLYQVSKNECLMLLRKQQTRRNIPLESVKLEAINEEAAIEYRLQQLGAEISQEGDFEDFDLEHSLNKMEKAIEKLSKEQKICIELFYLQEKCYKEIVELTGYELSKVKSYIQNGKRNLKLLMTN